VRPVRGFHRTCVAALVVGLLVLVVSSAASGFPPGLSSGAAGGCDAATADRLVEQQHLGNAGFSAQPVAQVLCGAFVGPHSNAMVVSLSTPGCGFSIGWAVYRADHGRWQRVFLTNMGALLAKTGSRIRAWQGVLGPHDPHCSPSGWKTRYWHWNSKRLVAGSWQKSGPPPNPLPGVPSSA
jgi:hypothetical protein